MSVVAGLPDDYPTRTPTQAGLDYKIESEDRGKTVLTRVEAVYRDGVLIGRYQIAYDATGGRNETVAFAMTALPLLKG